MEMTIAVALRQAARILPTSVSIDARRDARLLLGFVLDKDLSFLIARDEEQLTTAQQKRFFELIKRRTHGEPLQYILGKQEFYKLDFEVNQSVLIPRPETELLVEAALEILRKKQSPAFCDVGTGSGCISIAILKNAPQANCVALDISTAALEVAERNAARHNVQDRIEFVESNVFDSFQNPKFKIQNPKFSLIVSNPPYIPQTDELTLQREVRDYEPHKALFSGVDGLGVIRRLLADAEKFLAADNGFLLFEIGFGQSEEIKFLIDENIWRLDKIIPDFQAIPRVVVLEKKC